jgi:hypothetical protein
MRDAMPPPSCRQGPVRQVMRVTHDREAGPTPGPGRGERVLRGWTSQPSRLVGLAGREGRTPQESLVADMLTAVGLAFREQVPLVVGHERLIFDFIVERAFLVECSYSDSSCTRAWDFHRQRLAYLDYKFRVARRVGTVSTVALLEAPRCVTPTFPYPDMRCHLTSTDHIVTTIPDLGTLLINLLHDHPMTAQIETNQEGLERWLSAGQAPRRQTRRTVVRMHRTEALGECRDEAHGRQRRR